jgi:hypothetical protein
VLREVNDRFNVHFCEFAFVSCELGFRDLQVEFVPLSLVCRLVDSTFENESFVEFVLPPSQLGQLSVDGSKMTGGIDLLAFLDVNHDLIE